MNLTDEQHAICQAARDLGPQSWLKIQAFAGTGKTTTLAAIAESLAQRKFLYLVFNRCRSPSSVTSQDCDLQKRERRWTIRFKQQPANPFERSALKDDVLTPRFGIA